MVVDGVKRRVEMRSLGNKNLYDFDVLGNTWYRRHRHEPEVFATADVDERKESIKERMRALKGKREERLSAVASE